MTSAAARIAEWATALEPTAEDLALADRSLADTLAVTLAARDEELVELSRELPEAERWSAIAHVLDFDDLHMESTSHISTVCVPAALATGGDARAYLAGAGAMARIGVALGWQHYAAGWHITCTAGAPAAAVAASIALGLDAEATARAIALSVPAAGGVQKAFGTHGKSLQVGFATGAGVRAARLAARGASADPAAFDQWLSLLGADELELDGPAIPGGLAIKIYPCCYALQRPISAIAAAVRSPLAAADIASVRLSTPEGTVQPLIHHRPTTGLEGKFSLEYAVATAILDQHSGFVAFQDEAVQRPEAQAIIRKVETTLTPGGEWLLDGHFTAEIELTNGEVIRTSIEFPPGSPGNPAGPDDLAGKFADCGPEVPALLAQTTWQSAPAMLRGELARWDARVPAAAAAG